MDWSPEAVDQTQIINWSQEACTQILDENPELQESQDSGTDVEEAASGDTELLSDTEDDLNNSSIHIRKDEEDNKPSSFPNASAGEEILREIVVDSDASTEDFQEVSLIQHDTADSKETSSGSEMDMCNRRDVALQQDLTKVTKASGSVDSSNSCQLGSEHVASKMTCSHDICAWTTSAKTADDISEGHALLGERNNILNTPLTVKLMSENLPPVSSNNRRTTDMDKEDNVKLLHSSENALQGPAPTFPQISRRSRKLTFEEPLLAQVCEQETKYPSACNDLSYLNSQEPGEESQANAFMMVEKLAWLNGADHSQVVSYKEQPMLQEGLVKRTPQALLQVVEEKNRTDPVGVFDFVDSQQDQGIINNVEKQTDPNIMTGRKPKRRQDTNEFKPRKRKEGPKEKEDLTCEEVPVSECCTETTCVDTTGQALTYSEGNPKHQNQTIHASIRGSGLSKVDTKAIDGKNTIQGEGNQSSSKNMQSATLKRRFLKSIDVGANQPIITRRKVVSPAIHSVRSSLRERQCRHEPGSFRVLFSHGLGKDIVRRQKKILEKLGGYLATKPSDCTHFVVDKFMRTGNMLECMAAGKLVVTVSWLESCALACCFLDAKTFILEDLKKEKELRFSMRRTLAAALQKPLLQNITVYITPNAKAENFQLIITAAGGKVLDANLSILKKRNGERGYFVISCEEDYKICKPLLNKGMKIYSTEFLYRGIVVHQLDLSKNLLFEDG